MLLTPWFVAFRKRSSRILGHRREAPKRRCNAPQSIQQLEGRCLWLLFSFATDF